MKCVFLLSHHGSAFRPVLRAKLFCQSLVVPGVVSFWERKKKKTGGGQLVLMKEKKGRTGNCHKWIIMLKAGPTDTPLNNNNYFYFYFFLIKKKRSEWMNKDYRWSITVLIFFLGQIFSVTHWWMVTTFSKINQS